MHRIFSRFTTGRVVLVLVVLGAFAARAWPSFSERRMKPENFSVRFNGGLSCAGFGTVSDCSDGFRGELIAATARNLQDPRNPAAAEFQLISERSKVSIDGKVVDCIHRQYYRWSATTFGWHYWDELQTWTPIAALQ